MATRAQIANWYQNNKDTVKTYMKNNKLGRLYKQVKKYDGRDDVAVHVYDGPFGVGFSLSVKAIEGEDEYVRTMHFGPESRPDDTGWVLKVEETI